MRGLGLQCWLSGKESTWQKQKTQVQFLIQEDGTCHGAGVQPRLIKGIRSGDGVGEDQDTIASIRY